MLQITEDTPPDMLAGAMDLTVHLPTGRAVKMAVERSTPMMDLLVQITTNYHLQLSNYTLQALGMAPSSEHSDKILPYKPNTPIGTLDTQHIKVVTKPRTLPVPKNVPPGHQPFESTFRLKVHLPRNQLYVTRVSRNVLLEDIMKKVCEEKNLDSAKYDFKHPGNLDEVLDPKLTLSDYQITEIYVVAKGTVSLTQAFSSNDIMALRKEEERKQMHNKTGGGVFNLIFRKGKSSMGSGSISSDTRSISPTHSDDSRSVTPPAVQQKITTAPKKEPPPPERPKPPQRKRRPAPKPPVQSTEDTRRNSEESRRVSEESQRPTEEARAIEEIRRNSEEKPSSNISEVSELQCRKAENGLTICHSRNSSDSSGYHEASVLSENGNTSLPRRPKSAFVTAGDLDKVSKMHSQSTTNLSKMSCHSKSTTSLGLAGRKKKAAPPPPPTIRASNPNINVVENASPVVVASQPPAYQQDLSQHVSTQDTLVEVASYKPIPKPRKTTTPTVHQRQSPPKPGRNLNLEELGVINKKIEMDTRNKPGESIQNAEALKVPPPMEVFEEEDEEKINVQGDNKTVTKIKEDRSITEIEESLENKIDLPPCRDQVKPPKIVEIVPKICTGQSNFDISYQSQISNASTSTSTDTEAPFSPTECATKRSIVSPHPGIKEVCEYPVVRQNSLSSVRSLQNLPDFMGGLRKWNNLEELDDLSFTSLMGPNSNSWVLGDQSETESFSSQQALDSLASITSNPSLNIAEVKKEDKFFGSTDSGIAQETTEKLSEAEEIHTITPPPPPILEDLPQEVDIPDNTVKDRKASPDKIEDISAQEDFEPEERLIEPIIVPKEFTDPKPVESNDDTDWQYQIPSPPKAFRDSSPGYFNDTPKSDCKDSVVTSPELFEKLKTIEDSQFDKETITSDVSSVGSEEPLCNNLTLENLEKRKSLVYNRELTTSLKMSESDILPNRNENVDSFSSSLSKFESTFMEIQKSSHMKDIQDSKYVQRTTVHTTNTLPNFKISTYDHPKQKIKVFEDDTVRSNTENFSKIQKQESSRQVPALSRSFLGRSMENIAFKPPRDTTSSYIKEEKEYRFMRSESSTGMPKSFGPMSNVFRSESFTGDSHWSPSRPVSRSRSQLSLNANKHKEKQNQDTESSISRSNSLYDVSGLQSLGVMRLIQNKLSTPTSSMENLNQYNKYKNSSYMKPEPKSDAIPNKPLQDPQSVTNSTSKIIVKETFSMHDNVPSRKIYTEKSSDLVPPKPTATVTSFAEPEPPKEEPPKPSEKVYKYRGPPSISVSTWSERPKVPVNIKEDSDYKLSNHNVNSKLLVSTTNNDITSNNKVEIRNNFNNNQESRGVSIKVNGTESTNGNHYQSGSNVVIKIGDNRPKTIDNQRFINHTTAAGYRKPFSSISTNHTTQRPHSIAFDSEFDISRVPVVRSFELKKPYKDMANTSVTQIYHEEDNIKASTIGRSDSSSELSTRFSGMQNRQRAPEETPELARRFATMNSRNSYSATNGQESRDSKPAFRVSGFKPLGAAPVVRGFKQNNDVNIKRMTWNGSNIYNTLPAKTKEVEATQNNNNINSIPFSQSNLRRTESNKVTEKNCLNQKDLSNVYNNFNSLPSIQKQETKAPPPPLMPKSQAVRKPLEPVVDQRDQLLSAIRNFGGKKGLKAVKA